MYEIALATVQKGAVPFKEGNINDTYRGLILLEDGTSRGAIIKDLDPMQLANELLVSSLAKNYGVPTPDGFLALVPNGVLAITKGPSLPSGEKLVFASADVGVPNLTQRLSCSPTEQSVIFDEVVNWPHLGDLYALDSWVANIDRHPGNLLYGGSGKIWLIDHGHCLTGPDWKPAQLDPDGKYNNRLKLWLTPRLNSTERKKRSGEAGKFESAVASGGISELSSQSKAGRILTSEQATAAEAFLAARASKILFHANIALDEASLV